VAFLSVAWLRFLFMLTSIGIPQRVAMRILYNSVDRLLIREFDVPCFHTW
jgi:hypothetical protein